MSLLCDTLLSTRYRRVNEADATRQVRTDAQVPRTTTYGHVDRGKRKEWLQNGILVGHKPTPRGTVRRSKEITRRRELIERFTDEYGKLLKLYDEADEIGLGTTTLIPRDGAEGEIAQLRRAVDWAAGPAADAAEKSGVRLLLHGQQVNLITNWQRSLGGFLDRLFGPEDVLSYCDQVLGRLDAEYEVAKRAERSPAGLVARFVGFPTAVRHAAGLRNRVADRALGAAVGLLQTLLVTVLATVVAGLVLAFVFGIGR